MEIHRFRGLNLYLSSGYTKLEFKLFKSLQEEREILLCK